MTYPIFSSSSDKLIFTPHTPSDYDECAQAIARLMHGANTIAITGAGLSTDAGIPDYRGKGSTHIPTVNYEQFISQPMWQRWVWYRNQQTWKTVEKLEPTPGHRSLKKLQDSGFITAIATQNVDGLEEKAGIDPVELLHGTFRTVTCIDCQHVFRRDKIDELLRKANPKMIYDNDPAHVAILATADKKAALQCHFNCVECPQCKGLLKPSVIFFGEMLPEETMKRAIAGARQADVVLIIGTSLAVLTGLSLVYEAIEYRHPRIVVINQGPTAVDDIANIRVLGGSSQTLTAISRILCGNE